MTRLVLLPGLGASHRLFDPQRRAWPDLQVPPWLDPEPHERLPAYARRMAAALPPGDPDLVLGGVSFGGMVALEIARHVPARAVILIASATGPQGLTRAARTLALAGRSPFVPAVRPPRPTWPLISWGFGARRTDERALMYDLIRTSRRDLVKWGLGAIAHWRPAPEAPCAVRQIHGAEDRLIGAARVAAEVVVRGAGHLINVTHDGDVNAFIRLALADTYLREATRDDHERVRAFYVACGHSGVFDPADRVLLAEAGGRVLGAVRLCREHGTQVLRTMRVHPEAQRRGIGRLLLRRFESMLSPGDCYCLPYAHLVGFYGAIGFAPVPREALPPHLAARLDGYLRERPTMIAMRRPR